MRNVLILACLLAPAAALADPSYAVKVDAPAAKKAQKAVASVHIAPGAGFHVNRDYPLSMTVTPAGCSVEKPKQTAKDAIKLAEDAAQFDVAFTCPQAGKQAFTAELKFAVCSANSCDPKKEKLAFSVDVN